VLAGTADDQRIFGHNQVKVAAAAFGNKRRSSIVIDFASEMTPDYTPPPGIRSIDPEQLPLGAFEGVPMLPDREHPPERGAETPDVVREPPVCGEWSFDVSDDADTRGGALVVDSLARPVAPAPLPRPSTSGAGMQRQPMPSRLAPLPPARSAAGTTATRTEAVRAPSLTPPTPLPALDELRSIHEAQPGDARTAISLAQALDKRGNIERALSVLQRAIDAGADAVLLRCARATILSGRLRYDDAEAELKKASKIRTDDPDVLLQMGILACRRAKWRDAVEPLEKVVRLDSRSGQAHFYLGEALNKLDRLPDAFAAYERSAELEPENWRALKGVGIVLDRMGRPADAAAYYRRARDAQSG
jgi:Flp pilus assembly protein TadD